MGDGKEFTERSQLINSLVSSGVCSKKQVEVQICPFCDNEFPTRLEVLHHITMRHISQTIRRERREAWVCNLCNAMHLKFEALYNHVKQQHGDVTYSEFVVVKEEIDALTPSINTLSAELNSSINAINTLRSHIDISTTEHNTLNPEFDTSIPEIIVSNAEINILNPEIDTFNSEFDILNSEDDASHPEIDSSFSEIDSSTQNVDTLKPDIDIDESWPRYHTPRVDDIPRSPSKDLEESLEYPDLRDSQLGIDNGRDVDVWTKGLESHVVLNRVNEDKQKRNVREGLRSANAPRYDCEHCNVYFNSKSSCEAHMRLTHCIVKTQSTYDSSKKRIVKTGFKNITISKMVFKNKNSREAQRCNFCFYCGKNQTHISRHLARCHRKEKLVAKALAKPSGDVVRRAAFDEIRKLGNMKHNTEVLVRKRGILRPERRSRILERVVEDFLPCLYCHGLFRKNELLKHHTLCKMAPALEKPKLNRRYAKSLAQVAMYAPKYITSSSFCTEVLEKMSHDEIHRTILSDNFILKLGESQYATSKDIRTGVQQTKSNIRECARLLLEVRKLEPSVTSFKQLLCVKNWDLLVNAAMNLVGSVGVSSKFLAVKLGIHIAKIADLILTEAVEETDYKEVQEFKKHRDQEWRKCVIHKVKQKVRTHQHEKVDLILLAEDLRILTVFIKDNIGKCIEEINTGNANQITWLKLAKFLLVRLAIFNRQRIGDISAFEVSEFKNRSEGPVDSLEISITECHFASIMPRCFMVGNRSRDVPVLMTQDMVDNLNLLVDTRSSIGQVPCDNVFMFANKFAYCTGHFSIQCLRDITNECKAKNLEFIRSAKLRSHIATISQLFDLGHETELIQLSTFMKLNVQFDKNYYLMPENTLQVCKMSLILRSIDRGTSTHYDKSLAQIELCDIPEAQDVLSLYPIDADSDDEDIHLKETPCEVSAAFCSPDNNDRNIRTPTAKKPNEPGADRPKRQRINYTPWTAEENAALNRGFSTYYASLERPRLKDIEDFMLKEAVAMVRRNVKNVRDQVQTKISKLRNMRSKKH